MSLKTFTSALVLLACTVATAQNVAINNDASPPNNSAMLDIKSSNSGLLIPRMTQAQRIAIASPATGLLVYQLDINNGFYYNSSTPVSPIWVYLGTVYNTVWLTHGNEGTTAGPHFIGTIDEQAFVIKTNGIAAANERMRVLATPQVLINRTTAQPGDLFSVYGTGSSGATNSVTSQTDFPINGYSTGAFAGIYGENTATGQGVLGSNSGTGAGVYGTSNNVNGYGVFGLNQAAGNGVGGTSNGGHGVNGVTNASLFAGVRGFNQHTSGTGILGLGNNNSVATLPAGGAGVAGIGNATGGYFVGKNATTGIGVMAGGANITAIMTLNQGEAIAATGLNYGTVSYATAPLGNGRWAGYFDFTNSTNGYAWVGGRASDMDFGILSFGTKSTMVKDFDNRNRIMFCTETPEVLFQDYGSGQLVDGRAHIDIDPLVTKNIAPDKPIRIFIQPEGNCKGVYVINKSSAGFDVIELDGGRSTIAFTWQITGNRANTRDDQGNITNRFADARFPVGPDRTTPVAAEVVTTKPPLDTPVRLPLKGIDKKE